MSRSQFGIAARTLAATGLLPSEIHAVEVVALDRTRRKQQVLARCDSYMAADEACLDLDVPPWADELRLSVVL